MKQNTGLMHSETRGPLTKLIENLSGRNGEYWLESLQKMLRREKLPEPSKEILREMEGFNTRENAQLAVQKLVDYLLTIPTVIYAHACCEGDNDLINIGVYPNLEYFLQKEMNCDDAYFYLKTNGMIRCGGVDESDADFIYDQWTEKFDFEKLKFKDFCNALLELGRMYENAVLSIEY